MKTGASFRAFFVLGLCLLPSLRADELWTARCNGLLFAYDRVGKRAHLYFEKGDVRFPIAAGPILADDDQFLQAMFLREDWASEGIGGIAGRVGINRQKKQIELERRTRKGKQIRRVFCKAKLRIHEENPSP